MRVAQRCHALSHVKKGSAALGSRVGGLRIRLPQEPPRTSMTVSTPWADVRLTADDWAEAFAAAEPGVPHNEARDRVWEELLTILADKHQDLGGERGGEPGVPQQLLHRSLLQNEELVAAFSRAWPLLDPPDVVADLWSVPAFVARCAPWLSREDVAVLQRANPRDWTVSDLPLLDAARHRLGDPEASRRSRHRDAAFAAQREEMASVIDRLIEADDDGEGLVTSLRQQDLKDVLVDEDALPTTNPTSNPRNVLAGPFAHVVVDEAQELTDAQWQMLLLRCPSRSFTIVGDRAQARHGFGESWHDRLERVGFGRVRLASLSINYRTPAEVMAEAEPVIRAAVPDANVPTSIRSSGVPVTYGSRTELASVLDSWGAASDEGIACVLGDPAFRPDADRWPRVRSLTPESAKGLEFDLVVLVDPAEFGAGIEGAVDRYVAMTRTTSRLV